MSQPLWLLAFGGGFMVGPLLFASVTRWGYAVWVAVWEQRGSNSRAAIPVVLFLHSGPWLLAAVIFMAVHFLSRPHGPEWTSFFASIGVAVVLMFIPIVRFLRHVRGRS